MWSHICLGSSRFNEENCEITVCMITTKIRSCHESYLNLAGGKGAGEKSCFPSGLSSLDRVVLRCSSGETPRDGGGPDSPDL